MPLLTIHLSSTMNQSLREEAISEAANSLAHELGKPASVVMVSLIEKCQLSLGEFRDNLALFEIRAIEYPTEKTQALTDHYCGWAEKYLSIPGDHVFVIAENVPRGHWGFDRRVF